MTWTRLTIIVAAARRASANILAAAIDPDSGGSDTFTAGYSATGEAPATHYVSSGLYSDATMPILTSGNAATIYSAAVSLAAARGRTYAQTQNAVGLVLASSIIAEGDPLTVITSQGLQPVRVQP